MHPVVDDTDVHSAVVLVYFIGVQLRLAAIVTTQWNVECVGLQFCLALNKKKHSLRGLGYEWERW